MNKEIFISWSGPRSKFVAEALYDWIPRVIQSVNPWMSSEDIRAGDRWFIEISKKLEDSDFGIICITPENLTSPWLLFEAGALAKTITDENFVCPYLINLNPTDFQSPLNHFQSVKATKDDTFNLIKSINNVLGADALNERILKDTFDRFWPDLHSKLEDLPSSEVEEEPKRGDSDILSEILELVRSLTRSDDKKPTIVRYVGEVPHIVGGDNSVIYRLSPEDVEFNEEIENKINLLDHQRDIFKKKYNELKNNKAPKHQLKEYELMLSTIDNQLDHWERQLQ